MKNKILRIFIIGYCILILVLFSTWSVWHVLNNGKMFSEPVAKLIIEIASFPAKVIHTLVPTSVPNNIFDTRKITDINSKDGVTLFTKSSNLSTTNLLISTFKSKREQELKIIQLPSGKMIKKWIIPIEFEENVILKLHELPRLNHPLMLKDSTVVLKETQKRILFSLAKNNKINWVDSSLIFHHSSEQENDSTIWVPSIAEDPKHYKIDGFRHDAICSIDPRNGKIKFIKSVADILIENGYKTLLDNGYEDDGIHLNDIQPALSSSKYWEKGDLMLSVRNRNTILLYRPKTNKIIWLKTGPWLAQHDCDFVDQKTIMVFGNDIIRQKNNLLINGHNDIYFYDFEKDRITKPYSKVMKQLDIKTKTEGRCDLLENGDMFIDETNNGKLYIINIDSLKMIYTERYDKNHIKMFNWVRPILN